MIRALLEQEDREISMPGIFGAKQSVIAKCGGEMWRQNRCIITRLGRMVTLSGEPEDLSELQEFLYFLGGQAEGEAAVILQMSGACAQYEPWLSDFSYRCRHHFSKCFLLLARGQPAGVFCLLFRACGQALGGAFGVLPAFRKQGYGGLLLNYGAAFCTRQRERLFLIAKNQKVAKYYEKRGWLQKGLAADWNFQEAL